LPLVAAMVLAGRGLSDPESARTFLDCTAPLPDPFLFGHMEAVARKISDAIDRRRRIVVHGDYDADGVTATALLMSGLREMGAAVDWYLPSRFKEGYGLSRTAVEAIADGGEALLITVDCGVNYPDEVALATTLGLDVVVVDHHQPGPVLPECQVIHSAVGTYPHDDLCGVGLALKVMHAVHVLREDAPASVLPEPLHSLLDLVAVGTIADLASLRGENRYYVREGVKLINIGSRPGLRALAAVSACAGNVDSGAVAFRLAPRLNAAGRLADPSPPLRLLLTEDEEEAAQIAAELHELNGARQEVEREILEQAVAQVEALERLPTALVLGGEGWHEGVVGIVASRLVERYHRPTILVGLREGVAKGSGRSIPKYDLMAALNACSEHLTVYGGHRQAVGLTMDAEALEDFREAVERHAAASLDACDLRPVYRADAVLRGEEANADTATALGSLGPFGSGNPRPRLLLVEANVRHPEVTRNGAHLRCQIETEGVRTKAIGFRLGEMAAPLREDGEGKVLGAQLVVDEWQGVLRPQFLLERVGGNSGDPPRLCVCGVDREIDCVTGRETRPDEARPAGSHGRREGTASVVAEETLLPVVPRTRDLRDRPGRAAAIAQVVGGAEPAAILTSSVPQALQNGLARIPLEDLSGGTVECVGRACWPGPVDRISQAGLVIVEWDTAVRAPWLVAGRAHAIAADPPYREEHVALLRRLADEGVLVHLYYGEAERRATASLLRYTVHPRFAMVCVYRAMDDAADEEGLMKRAARLGEREAGVILGPEELLRARRVLEELGIRQAEEVEARIEPKRVPAYLAAEAEYKECLRLCQIL
jgi:single-stranded-DNA-specific exonuclease